MERNDQKTKNPWRWRLLACFLIEEGLSENTVRRRSGIAKQFFTAAMRKGLVSQNTFSDLKSAIQSNTSRFYFISRSEASN